MLPLWLDWYSLFETPEWKVTNTWLHELGAIGITLTNQSWRQICMSLGGSQTSPELLKTHWTSENFPKFSSSHFPGTSLIVWILEQSRTRDSPEVPQTCPELPRTSPEVNPSLWEAWHPCPIWANDRVPDSGNEWRKFRAVPRLHPLRSLVLYFVQYRRQQKGF